MVKSFPRSPNGLRMDAESLVIARAQRDFISVEIEQMIGGGYLCYLLGWGFFVARRLSQEDVKKQVRVQWVAAVTALTATTATVALDGAGMPQWLVMVLGFPMVLGFVFTALGTVVGGFLIFRRELRQPGIRMVGVGVGLWFVLFALGVVTDALTANTP